MLWSDRITVPSFDPRYTSCSFDPGSTLPEGRPHESSRVRKEDQYSRCEEFMAPIAPSRADGPRLVQEYQRRSACGRQELALDGGLGSADALAGLSDLAPDRDQHPRDAGVRRQCPRRRRLVQGVDGG